MTRRWIKTIIFSLLLINLAAVYFFQLYISPVESSIIFRLTLTLLIVWVWYTAYKKDQYEQLIVITYFLTVYNLDKLYLAISLSISIILLLAAFFSSALFYSSIRLNMAHNNKFVPLYSLLVGLISAETFLVSSIWSPNNATLSAMVSVSFYYIWHLILAYLNHRLKHSLAFQYTFFSLAALVLIIITTSWYNNF